MKLENLPKTNEFKARKRVGRGLKKTESSFPLTTS